MNCFQGIAESKTGVGDEDVRNTAVNLVMVSQESFLFRSSTRGNHVLTLKFNLNLWLLLFF